MTTLRLSRPADVLTSLPYVLGYHPLHSVVVIALRGTTVGPIQRVDRLVGKDRYPIRLLKQVVRTVRADGSDRVMLVAYDDNPVTQVRGLEKVTTSMTAAGIDVLDRLVVADGRWWSLDCLDGQCCPPGGTPIPSPARTPQLAELVALGVAPVADRDALVDRIEPVEGVAPYQLAALAAVDLSSVEEVYRAWTPLLDLSVAAEHLTEEQAAMVVASAQVYLFRDGILDWLCPGLLGKQVPGASKTVRQRMWGAPPHRGREDAGAGSERLARLMEFARRLPAGHRADLVVMIGAYAWWLGECTIASVCLDRVLGDPMASGGSRDRSALAPGHVLAGLLRRVVDAGLRPRDLVA
ncbi:DUF4192 domain-containing protein [Austwickia sp. TVS 96-490-7B]|uniref:DUF4192 domain-containing protein n=1 Tax=Austwickia sp. TVS 96-490-7B TaxID=2830843 RepID=UPI001C57B598|nr:DUF4192 domain-containing protein [Austwickia sp. TVS 96-490-7B]